MSSNSTNAAYATLAVLALLVAAGPMASAQSTGFGTVVAPQNGDTTYELSGIDIVWCFIDDDDSTSLNSDEALYLVPASSCPSAVPVNAIRASNPVSGQTKGSQVRSSHSDFDDPIISLSYTMRIVDMDGDDTFTAGDTLVLDVGSSGTLTINDVIISGSNAGTIVTSGTSGINGELRELGDEQSEDYNFFDADGSGEYDSGDVIYLDLDSNNFATIQDVRFGTSDFGGVVNVTSFDTVFSLSYSHDGSKPRFWCFIDDDD